MLATITLYQMTLITCTSSFELLPSSSSFKLRAMSSETHSQQYNAACDSGVLCEYPRLLLAVSAVAANRVTVIMRWRHEAGWRNSHLDNPVIPSQYIQWNLYNRVTLCDSHLPIEAILIRLVPNYCVIVLQPLTAKKCWPEGNHFLEVPLYW